MRRVLLSVILAAGCGGHGSTGGGGGTSALPPRHCDLATLGLGAAHVVPMYEPPAACSRPGNSGARDPIRSEAQFRAAFTCPPGVGSGIDFDRDQLMVQQQMMSPMGVGGEVVDDGKTVSYVPHERIPCAGEPHLEPMDVEVMYLLPAGSEREYQRVGGCTVARCER
jgi:hypothetical protein